MNDKQKLELIKEATEHLNTIDVLLTSVDRVFNGSNGVWDNGFKATKANLLKLVKSANSVSVDNNDFIKA